MILTLLFDYYDVHQIYGTVKIINNLLNDLWGNNYWLY